MPMPLDDPDKVGLKALRVAFFTNNGVRSPTPETAAVIRSAINVLNYAGLAVEEARANAMEQTFDIFMSLMGADAGDSHQASTGSGRDARDAHSA